MCFIFHNGTVKVRRVLYQVTTVLYETSKLNKVQLCMERSHLYKQHHLECVNIPETVNNSMRLCLVFHFLKCFAQANYL